MKIAKSLVSKLGMISFLGLATALSTANQAKAAIVNIINNDQVWAYELANGQRINMPQSQRFVGGRLYSYPADNTGDQHFKMISRGDGYNFQLNGTNLSFRSPTSNPASNGTTQLVVATTNVSDNNQYFYFDSIDSTETKFLLRLKSNSNFCINVPGSQQNVVINLFPCNANDPDQIWRKTYITGNPNYVQPLPNGSVGILESQAGKRVSIPNLVNGGTIEGRAPNNNDASQRIKFNWNGYAYTLHRDQTTYGLSSTSIDYIGRNGNAMSTHTYNNAGGRWGGFGFVDLGGGYFQVKSFFYPKYCLSTSSGALVVLFTCNSGDPNQRFRVSEGVVRVELEEVNPVYKIYLASLRPSANIFDASGETGHSWIGLVKFYSQDRVTYIDNVETNRVRYVDGLTKVSSVSAPGPFANNFYVANDPAEIARTNLLINADKRFQVPGNVIGYDTRGGTYFGSSTRTISYLVRDISYQKYLKFLPQADGGLGSTQNCFAYALVTTTTSGDCSCSSLALRIFEDAYGSIDGLDGLESVTIPNPPNLPVTLSTITPLGLSWDIDRINKYSDWDINR